MQGEVAVCVLLDVSSVLLMSEFYDGEVTHG